MNIDIPDPRLARIFTTAACPELPLPVVRNAHRLMRLLTAAASWSDIGVFTKVALLKDGRFAAPVHGRWAISFEWDDELDRIVNPSLERF